MRGLLRYIAAELALLLMLCAALAGMVCFVTTGTFVEIMTDTAELRRVQQERVETAAKALEERWQLSPEILAPYVENAVISQNERVIQWWKDLWTDENALAEMPAYLNPAQDLELRQKIREDEGFIAVTDPDQRSAIARDEIAFALDDAVCDAVTPLRRSIVDMVFGLAAEMDLPYLRTIALYAAAGLAAAALVLLLIAHRVAGSTLQATGLTMAVLTAPVWLMDVSAMLTELNPIAALQGGNALMLLGILWYGAAAALVLLGLIINGLKRLAAGGRE